MRRIHILRQINTDLMGFPDLGRSLEVIASRGFEYHSTFKLRQRTSSKLELLQVRDRYVEVLLRP